MEPEEEIEELRRLSEQIVDIYYTGKEEESYALLDETLTKSKSIEAYRLFFEAQIARFKNKDYTLQEELVRKAIEIRPEDYFLINNLGISLSLQDKEKEAICCFDEALMIKPDFYDALCDKGIFLSIQGKEEEAIQCYDEALKIKPDFYDALHNKGLSLSHLGKEEEAIRCYDEALKIKPDFYDALNNKGNSLSKQGKEEEAIQCYDEVLKIKPDSSEALSNKGVSLLVQGREDEAMRYFDEALRIKPDFYNALASKGLSLSNLGNFEEAIRYFDEALRIKPDDSYASMERRKCLSKQKMAEAKRQASGEGPEIKPEHDDAGLSEVTDDSTYKLKSIELKGYKSIDSEGQRIEFGDVTVLIGPNGAGKSNLISFFRMINRMMDEDLKLFVGIHGGTPSFLYFGPETTPALSAEIAFFNGKDTASYSFKLAHMANETFVFNTEEIIVKKPEHPEERIVLQTTALRESMLKSQSRKSLGKESVIYNLLKKCLIYQLHDTSFDSAIRRRYEITDDSFLYDDARNLAAVLYSMLNNPATRWYYERIVAHIGTIFPQFADFVLEPYQLNPNQINLMWKEKGQGYKFGPQQLSDGTLRFMALTTLLLQPPEWLPKLIVIDEPELGLHPKAVAHLADMVSIASEHVQVVLATQSPHFLDEFEADQIVIVEYDEDKRCSTFKRRPGEERFKDWFHKYTNSDLWNMNLFGGNP
ncbi:tetratricopeptide repeat protein [Candidatus Magnetominusculus xianensis]|uniref:TPR repeat-containing protein n=1 Tax=Candidatus Magnetominusculus xianensis TaxID=1748249 RepID=A0ABR5SHD0_9BACT|nr:tetratricopeptide repeat protein [Candidatus Magnetominusculus xianensis]KWT87234.1 TPR repeat-containing protein [Candidatus Magnetominusculus xianensis]MBF0405067.1 tetratricopeptide repeat protein [Nitrospirota bacterium]